MRARVVLLAVAAMLAAVVTAAPVRAAAADAGVVRAQTAVVAITARGDIIGSGVIVADGLVLTAAHVVDDVTGYGPLVLVGADPVPFEVIGIDRTRDLALLRCDTRGVRPVAIADPSALARGDDVTAIGFPIGLRSVTFTRGVVSSPLQEFQGREFVQTDAAINPGNSGGPLVDARGRLVGINVEKVSGGGVDTVGFAVPVADAVGFVQSASPGASLDLPVSGAQRTVWSTFAVAAVALLALTVAYLVARRRAGAVTGAGATVAAPHAAQRRTFLVSGPGGGDERTVRLPAVVGSARNADIRVRDDGVAEYHARLTLDALGAVSVTSLVGPTGVYCGDECVTTAVLAPGTGFTVGRTHVTLADRREGQAGPRV